MATQQALNFNSALQYVTHVVNDAGNVRAFDGRFIPNNLVLVGWQCGFEPRFVGYESYLTDTLILDQGEAEEAVIDWLQEVGWFQGEPTEPGYIFTRG